MTVHHAEARWSIADVRPGSGHHRGEDWATHVFWLAEALAVTDRPAEAEQALRRAAACANDLGLIAEQTSGATGDCWATTPRTSAISAWFSPPRRWPPPAAPPRATPGKRTR
ncbi:MAG TPA: hypothetical protein VIJ07_26395 [Dermatophilaceae bacterium]